ncbi:MAG: aldo/keto reductase [Propionibacteriaceae bacterium]|jgi:diketogulonate reductase-like aldo/keto reductase|nr:aldo/keto reductase [Propionibacteriaceae bacterium]
MSVLTENFTLANGAVIPKLGFGTWQTPNEVAPQAVREAVELGYTHIDTARAYQNEQGVGEGLRSTGIARDAVFITTKIPAEFKSYDQAKKSIETSLKELGESRIDLLLIHAPRPWAQMADTTAPRYFEENRAVWQAMEEAVDRGEVASIGVSNFQIDDLTNITDHCRIAPVANQIRFHVGYTQSDVVEYCAAHDILIEAYSPIGTGRLLKREDLIAMAATYEVSVAQLCIRYALQKGCLPLPKSTHRTYIEQNTHVDFEINATDMATLDALVIAD